MGDILVGSFNLFVATGHKFIVLNVHDSFHFLHASNSCCPETDHYGIIRDIVQNHLLQVLTLLAMEAPTKADGPEAGESIRNAKVQVLNSIPPITIDECFLGQYEGKWIVHLTISN